MPITLFQLNTWGGRADGYVDYLDNFMSRRPDIVCLQEVGDSVVGQDLLHKKESGTLANQYRYLRDAYWDNYEFRYAPRQSKWLPGNDPKLDLINSYWGNVIAWNSKRFRMIDYRETYVVGTHFNIFDGQNHSLLPTNVQGVVLIDSDDSRLLAINVHGWYAGHGVGKADNPEREQQVVDIIAFARNFTYDKLIISGDFNMRIDSELLEKLCSELTVRNVIKESEIVLTRTELYIDSQGNNKGIGEPHAPYVFCDVGSTAVCQAYPEIPMSDHAPVWAEFI